MSKALPHPHDLARFVSAQAPTYALALAEITAGQKRSHWMWYLPADGRAWFQR